MVINQQMNHCSYIIWVSSVLLRWKTGSPRIRSWGTCSDSMGSWDHPARILSEKDACCQRIFESYGPKEYLKRFEILYLWLSVHETHVILLAKWESLTSSLNSIHFLVKTTMTITTNRPSSTNMIVHLSSSTVSLSLFSVCSASIRCS